MGGRAFSYQAPMLWNLLLVSLQEADTLFPFKSGYLSPSYASIGLGCWRDRLHSSPLTISLLLLLSISYQNIIQTFLLPGSLCPLSCCRFSSSWWELVLWSCLMPTSQLGTRDPVTWIPGWIFKRKLGSTDYNDFMNNRRYLLLDHYTSHILGFIQ